MATTPKDFGRDTLDFDSLCVHGVLTGLRGGDPTGSVTVPVYQSATFAHPGVGQSTGYDYSRLQNPTREALEKALARLEGGADALAFSTGMAAVAAMMELFAPGDHVIASHDLYGGSYRLFETVSVKNGVAFDYPNTTDLSRVEALIRPSTKAIFIETPTNPMMNVTDIRAAADLAHRHGLLLVVDNTFLTPCFQRPLALGADMVLHSGTKYLGGHNDTLAGFLVPGGAALAERLHFIQKTTGACLAPWDSWLLLRGLKTLAVRMERQQETALILAGWLKEQPRVARVLYAGLPEHPGYAVTCRQTTGFGAMISFEVDSPETARRVLERVRLIAFAESLGGVESLITYPAYQTHADVPEAERLANGITDRLLRLSVGLESARDLTDDLARALA